MKSHKIKINTKSKKYSIFIGPKLINKLDKILISQKISLPKVMVVIDQNLNQY